MAILARLWCVCKGRVENNTISSVRKRTVGFDAAYTDNFELFSVFLLEFLFAWFMISFRLFVKCTAEHVVFVLFRMCVYGIKLHDSVWKTCKGVYLLFAGSIRDDLYCAEQFRTDRVIQYK